MTPRTWVWEVQFHNECHNKESTVNVVALNIAGAIQEGVSWLNKSENLDLSPEDCELVAVMRGVEIG